MEWNRQRAREALGRELSAGGGQGEGMPVRAEAPGVVGDARGVRGANDPHEETVVGAVAAGVVLQLALEHQHGVFVFRIYADALRVAER